LRTNLPVPVFLKRFAAALLVFNFGIVNFLLKTFYFNVLQLKT
jgi:hypothetical protein